MLIIQTMQATVYVVQVYLWPMHVILHVMYLCMFIHVLFRYCSKHLATSLCKLSQNGSEGVYP